MNSRNDDKDDFDKVAKSDLIQKAINYMHIFGEQLFRYRKLHGFEDVNS